MGLELSFKGSGEDYVSRIRREIIWTRIIIARGGKLITTDAPSAFLSLAGGRKRVLENYVIPGASREREGSRLFEYSLRLPVFLQFLSFSGMPLQAGRVLNARPICRCIGQVTVTFQRVAPLEIGAAYQARPFGSKPSRHV